MIKSVSTLFLKIFQEYPFVFYTVEVPLDHTSVQVKHKLLAGYSPFSPRIPLDNKLYQVLLDFFYIFSNCFIY